MRPRTAALYFFGSIIAAGTATGVLLALLLIRFISGSLLAAMGEACGGIFEASQGFLAESRINYLLAVIAAAVLFLQLAFLLGGGTRLFRVSHRVKKTKGSSGMTCPALSSISRQSWALHIFLVPDGAMEAETVGILRSRILLHSGLIRTLSGDELAAVAAHEEAHRLGRDNLIAAAAKAISLTLFYLPGPRLAYKEMCRAFERAADNYAAWRTGGPFHVASALATIVKVSHLNMPEAVLRSSMSGQGLGDITSRLQYLTGEERTLRRATGVSVLATAAVIAVLMTFASSAFAITGKDQRGALICYTEHTQETPQDGICLDDHSSHPGN